MEAKCSLEEDTLCHDCVHCNRSVYRTTLTNFTTHVRWQVNDMPYKMPYRHLVNDLLQPISLHGRLTTCPATSPCRLLSHRARGYQHHLTGTASSAEKRHFLTATDRIPPKKIGLGYHVAAVIAGNIRCKDVTGSSPETSNRPTPTRCNHDRDRPTPP